MNQNFAKISKVLAKSLGITTEELMHSYDRATAADIAAVCELMHLGFGVADNVSKEVIAWRYFDSSNNPSDIFVLRYQGKLIGAIGAEPIKVNVKGNKYEGIIASDIVVHPEHMKRGIGGWMNLYLQDKFPIVIAMGSNENSDTMVRRLFKPMNCRHHFKMLFSIKNYLEIRQWPNFIVTFASLLAVVPLALLRGPYLKSLPSGYTLSWSDNADNLALFFNDSEYQCRNLNVIARSEKYCRWRYDLNPKSQFKILELRKENRLVGYAAVKDKVAGTPLKDWQLMDWDFLPGFRDKSHLQILLSAVAKYAVKNAAQSLSVMASDELSRSSLLRTGFSHRAGDDGFFLWSQSQVDPSVLNENNWFLSLCDTDEAL
ncbi:MAG: GNAT family N-acetyltransferase [Pseudomonadota bacterium]